MTSLRSGRAFSLVELLVVIGIISILVSMLLPATAAVQQRAQLLQCTNNLRNIWMGAQLHVNDHRGYLPVAGWHWSPQGGVCNPHGLFDDDERRYTYYSEDGVKRPVPFTVAIALSLGIKVRLDSRETLEKDMQSDTVRKHFRCPSQEETRSGFTQREDSPRQWTGPEDVSSYVFNEAILGLREREPWRDPMPLGKLSGIRRPSMVLLAMDGCPRDRGKDRWLVFPDIGPEDTIIDFIEASNRPDSVWGREILDYWRHNCRANVLFADGHVATVLLLPSDLGGIGISKGVYW
jgi:prepilin-type processing-associated H-X9-DG protein/prepilin-type N-terminal cleavage/methylation domain-containing protein